MQCVPLLCVCVCICRHGQSTQANVTNRQGYWYSADEHEITGISRRAQQACTEHATKNIPFQEHQRQTRQAGREVGSSRSRCCREGRDHHRKPEHRTFASHPLPEAWAYATSRHARCLASDRFTMALLGHPRSLTTEEHRQVRACIWVISVSDSS